MGIVLIGRSCSSLILARPARASRTAPFPGSLLMSLLVVVFGFFFVTVSSPHRRHHRHVVEPDLRA